ANYPDAVVLHPDQPDLLFMTAGVGWPVHWYELGRARGKIFRSRDAGKTWERLLGGLPNGLRSLFSGLTIEARRDGYSLHAVDTDGQVFESLDGGESWTIIADVPPVSKADFYKGLVRDRVKLANVDDIVANPTATKRWQEAGKALQPSPISLRISAVCSPSRGAGFGDAIGAPSSMIGVRTPGIVPALASALGRSSFIPRCLTCGSSNTWSRLLIGPAGTPTASSLSARSCILNFT